jgi:hypothetical protein
MNKFTPLIVALILWMILMNIAVIWQADINDKLIKINKLEAESIRLLNDKLNLRLQCMPQPVTERHSLILLN